MNGQRTVFMVVIVLLVLLAGFLLGRLQSGRGATAPPSDDGLSQVRLLGVGVPEFAQWPSKEVLKIGGTVLPGDYVVAEILMAAGKHGSDNSAYRIEFTSQNSWAIDAYGFSTAVKTGKGTTHDRMLVWFRVRGTFTEAEKLQGDQEVRFKVKSIQAGSVGTNELSFLVKVGE